MPALIFAGVMVILYTASAGVAGINYFLDHRKLMQRSNEEADRAQVERERGEAEKNERALGPKNRQKRHRRLLVRGQTKLEKIEEEEEEE